MYSLYRQDQYKKAPFRIPIAKFGCENCGRLWKSANGSLGDYQICKNCSKKCYPCQFRWQEPNKKGNQNCETYLSHDSNLCGKCVRLGYSCIEARGEEQAEGDIRVNNEEGKEITLERSVNIFSNLIIDDKLYDFKKIKKVELASTSKKGKKWQREKDKQEWMALMDGEKKRKSDSSSNKDEVSSNKEEEKVVSKTESPASAITEQIEGLKVEQENQNDHYQVDRLSNKLISHANKDKATAETDDDGIFTDIQLKLSINMMNNSTSEETPVNTAKDDDSLTEKMPDINITSNNTNATDDNDTDNTKESNKGAEGNEGELSDELAADDNNEKDQSKVADNNVKKDNQHSLFDSGKDEEKDH